MYHTTGFSRDEILDLCQMVHGKAAERKPEDGPLWPPILGLFRSVVVALAYLRRNRVQAELGATYGVSQPTISRAVTRLTPLLGKVLRDHVPTADELDPRAVYVIDGTLLPCWSWAGHREPYSGRHKTTGFNVQVACTLSGRLAWVSDPVDGSRHDMFCMDESGVLTGQDPAQWTGDKGYAGSGMVTPIKKPKHRALLDWEKEHNTKINRMRYVIEQTIANFKTWRIMHTDYRRPLATFSETISTVIALHFYTMG